MWNALEQAQRDLGIPELSAAAFRDGRWHFHGDPERRYPIASVTKTFTARAIELAGIDLDARVSARLPGFRLHDARATRLMTVRDLLCHRSGLPPHTWAWVFARERRADWIRDRLPHLRHVGPHDAAYRYSNIGYAVAGALLPGDWERFLQANVLNPLGLSRTGFLNADWHRSPEVAPPHRAGRGVPPFVARAGHLIGPASELLSSAGDLARWLDHWREAGTGEAGTLEADTECFSSQVRMGGDRWYGLGWRREKDLCWHTGSCTGYSAIVALSTHRREALCILCNQHGVTRALETLARGGRVPADARPRPRAARTGGESSPRLGGRHGTWSHPGYGDLAIDRDGDVRFHDTPAGRVHGTTWRMEPYGLDFDIAVNGDDLAIGLEPALPPIKFAKRD